MIKNISGILLYFFSVLVYRTCRFTISGFDQVEIVQQSGNPVILTSWHGMTMMLIGSLRKKMDITSFVAIMPDDQRGEVLEVFARKLNVDSTPLNLEGDTTLGMSRKLIGLMRKISSGKNFLIHPDGPAGPAYKVKPGLSYIAKKTGTAIIPVGCYCRHAYHVPRWDRYTLPMPFSKIYIYFGEPYTIPKELSDLTQINHQLEDILNRVAAQAAANYYEL